VVAGAHHVCQRQQRRHQRIVLADVERVERAVGLRDAQRLGLGAAGLAAIAEEAAMEAGRLQPVLAEQAGAVGESEWHDHHLAAADRRDLAAYVLDDSDRFVAHLLAGHVRPVIVGPQVAAADAGAGYSAWSSGERHRERFRSGRRRPCA
jgi:hypothetical protein